MQVVRLWFQTRVITCAAFVAKVRLLTTSTNFCLAVKIPMLNYRPSPPTQLPCSLLCLLLIGTLHYVNIGAIFLHVQLNHVLNVQAHENCHKPLRTTTLEHYCTSMRHVNSETPTLIQNLELEGKLK